MALASKSRMISFRVTAEEYAKFRKLCFTEGVRSFSELARTAMNLMLAHESPSMPRLHVEARISEIEARVHLLALEVERLNQHGTAASAASVPLRLLSTPE